MSTGPINFSGSLREIRDKLIYLKEFCKNREASGYPSLMSDEEWELVDARDDRVDAECRAIRGKVYRGTFILTTFPDSAFVNAALIDANLHDGCRCTLEWVNPNEVVTERLRNESEGGGLVF